MNRIKGLSLFANVGIAETYLEDIGIDIVLANELEQQRAAFYKHLYPNAKVICGDITNPKIKNEIIESAKQKGIDLIMATPPCQGMSTAGKKEKGDIRNLLIDYAIDIVLELKPKFVFFENVPEQLTTKININGEEILIPDYIKQKLALHYNINKSHLINAADYGVPQLRERAIFLMTRKDIDKKWEFPKPDKKQVTLKDAIGDLPTLDPFVTDISQKERDSLFPEYELRKQTGEKISKWFYPPKHVYRQVFSMMHTPSGKTAFDNIDIFKPHKKDGSLTKGFKNTYKRQEWDKPAFTVTMYNRTIGSQNNVHPGRKIGKDKSGYDIYSDARVLTIYELLIIFSLPKDWNIPDWASDHLVRQVIGEGIPPLMVKKIMQEIC